ncbi:4Fe-4S single cluster domain-containing protein [Prescottella agglutinans]|nr:4Fe-4S single cluster domain-containing protein [Prescottella agglutinans]
MLLSRLHYPVTSLGFGRRAGIWFQGCTLHCRGCISRDTWPADRSTGTRVESVLAWLAGLDGVDGVTISGGEPTDQPESLRALLRGIDQWRRSRRTGDENTSKEVDVLLYSGRTAGELDCTLPWLKSSVDVLISGPFDQNLASDDPLRGSSNQVVDVCSDLGARRYPESSLVDRYSDQRRRIGVQVDMDTVWMVGIPLPGDLARLRAALAGRGVTLDRTSWLS